MLQQTPQLKVFSFSNLSLLTSHPGPRCLHRFPKLFGIQGLLFKEKHKKNCDLPPCDHGTVQWKKRFLFFEKPGKNSLALLNPVLKKNTSTNHPELFSRFKPLSVAIGWTSWCLKELLVFSEGEDEIWIPPFSTLSPQKQKKEAVFGDDSSMAPSTLGPTSYRDGSGPRSVSPGVIVQMRRRGKPSQGWSRCRRERSIHPGRWTTGTYKSPI